MQTFELENNELLLQIKNEATLVAQQLVETANLKKGDRVVVGCSTSEVLGEKVGTHSVPKAGEMIFNALNSVFSPLGIFICAQCCEHLNRAIIMEEKALRGEEVVNVVPQPKAGGSFATSAYNNFENPVAVEKVKADAGIDIGDTLIGMHLKAVAVPLRLAQKTVGEARVTSAKTRAKFIGGVRATYNDKLF